MKYKTTNILQLASTVLQRIQKEKLFNSQHNLLITFSGGQDSVFCLLVLFILKKKARFGWNRTKLLNLSKLDKTNRRAKKQSFFATQNKVLPKLRFLQRTFYNCFDTFLPITLFDIDFYKKGFAKAKLWQEKKNIFLFEGEKVAYNNVKNLLDNNYTLLWCNHFWQKDSFFTMEHVSKLTLCKNYTMYFFVPIKKILSEQDARNWRHKVMQRSSFFLRRKKCCYGDLELYLDFVLNTKPLLFTSILVLQKPVKLRSCTKERISYQDDVWRNSSVNTQPWPEQLCVQGHNKSDRAEAILFNLIKGTGMNGISTLQWKHTFFSPPNSNYIFYPIFSDFFKEIQIIFLNSLFNKTCKQKRIIKTNNFSLCKNKVMPKRSIPKTKLCNGGIESNCQTKFGKQLPEQIVPKQSTSKTKFLKNRAQQNWNKVTKTPLFCKNEALLAKERYKKGSFNNSKDACVQTLYYQLKYKIRKM